MSAAWIIAVITAATAFLGFCGWALALTFQAGKHAQQMETAKADIVDLKVKVGEHARSISSWDQALNLLQEVRDDVKGLLTGRLKPARRTETD